MGSMPINEAERKLAEYRAKKEREELFNRYKVKVNGMFTKLVKSKGAINKNEDNQQESTDKLLDPSISDSNQDEDDVMDIEENSPMTVFDYIQYFLWFVLWITIYAIFIKLQFGTVYFILSGIIGMYLNTRTKPKRKNEVSAYSVFNRNCESIDGTFDADQLTRQMLYGGLAR